MTKASRPPFKTLTINKSRDLVVDRLLKQCEEGAHPKCTGWAVLKKEISPIDANYFLRCTCACHHKKEHQIKKHKPKKSITMKIKRKVRKKGRGKQKASKRSKKKSRRTRNR